MFKVFNDTKNECIYDDNTVFADNSIIREPRLTMEASKAGSLSFIMRPGHSIDRHDVVYVTEEIDGEDKILWAGRVLSEARDEINEKQIECEGALAYMNDIIQAPSNRPEKDDVDPSRNAYLNFKAIIDYHNAAMWQYESRKFYIREEELMKQYCPLVKYTTGYGNIGWNAIYREYSKRTRESTFSNISREFLDRLGGQIRLSHVHRTEPDGTRIMDNYIEYIDSFDTNLRKPAQQTIEFGKNLISITRTASIDDFATVYIPQGRSLTDVEKSWPYIQPISNTKYKLIKENYPIQTEMEVSYKTGKYIDSETGALQSVADATFVVCEDIPVEPGEKYFLTTYLEGPNVKEENSKSFIGAVSYVVISGSGEIIATGSSAKNSTDTDTKQIKIAKVEVKETNITIPEFTDISSDLYLRIARKIDSAHEFVLRKYNDEYAEDTITIMSCDMHAASESDPIVKARQYPVGTDVFPAASQKGNVMAYEDSKIIYHSALTSQFGYIMRVYSKSDATTPDELYYYAASDLRKMEEKVALEIEAVDLSFIDKTVPRFELLDLVHVISEPHAIDTYLPILRIEIPLAEPEKAKYTLKNETSIYLGTPSYISQYMAETYKKV